MWRREQHWKPVNDGLFSTWDEWSNLTVRFLGRQQRKPRQSEPWRGSPWWFCWEMGWPASDNKLIRRNNWECLSVFFDYPPQIRKVIYTMNAIESLNVSLRKVAKTRRSFPTDESVMKILYLALHRISRKWTMPIRDWKQAMSQFMILFGDRVPNYCPHRLHREIYSLLKSASWVMRVRTTWMPLILSTACYT